MESLKDKIKQIIVSKYMRNITPEQIQNDELLFGGKLGLDSIFLLEIMISLEDEFDIVIADEDLRIELFLSVNSMAEYVESKL